MPTVGGLRTGSCAASGDLQTGQIRRRSRSGACIHRTDALIILRAPVKYFGLNYYTVTHFCGLSNECKTAVFFFVSLACFRLLLVCNVVSHELPGGAVLEASRRVPSGGWVGVP